MIDDVLTGIIFAIIMGLAGGIAALVIGSFIDRCCKHKRTS